MSLAIAGCRLRKTIKSKVWHYTFEEFIGVGSLVGNSFSIRGDDVDYEILWEFAEDEENWGPQVWGEGPYSIHELLTYEPGGTFILVHDHSEPVGFYTDGQCWINLGEHRGRGLSTHLILAACDHFDGLPHENGTLGYSEAGYAAHAAAYRYAVEQAFEEGLITSKLQDHLLFQVQRHAGV